MPIAVVNLSYLFCPRLRLNRASNYKSYLVPCHADSVLLFFTTDLQKKTLLYSKRIFQKVYNFCNSVQIRLASRRVTRGEALHFIAGGLTDGLSGCNDQRMDA